MKLVQRDMTCQVSQSATDGMAYQVSQSATDGMAYQVSQFATDGMAYQVSQSATDFQKEMNMNCNDLFAHLVQRMRSYTDASVLWVFLKEHADENEYAVSTYKLAEVQLCGEISKDAAHRSIKKLQMLGYLTARVRRNSETLVAVNRDAVLELLRQPVPERMPVVSQKVFPFLDAWNSDIAQRDSGASQDSDDSKLSQ